MCIGAIETRFQLANVFMQCFLVNLNLEQFSWNFSWVIYQSNGFQWLFLLNFLIIFDFFVFLFCKGRGLILHFLILITIWLFLFSLRSSNNLLMFRSKWAAESINIFNKFAKLLIRKTTIQTFLIDCLCIRTDIFIEIFSSLCDFDYFLEKILIRRIYKRLFNKHVMTAILVETYRFITTLFDLNDKLLNQQLHLLHLLFPLLVFLFIFHFNIYIVACGIGWSLLFGTHI